MGKQNIDVVDQTASPYTLPYFVARGMVAVHNHSGHWDRVKSAGAVTVSTGYQVDQPRATLSLQLDIKSISCELRYRFLAHL